MTTPDSRHRRSATATRAAVGTQPAAATVAAEQARIEVEAGGELAEYLDIRQRRRRLFVVLVQH